MKPLHRLLNFLFIGILLLACEDEQQTWLSEMEGTLDCGVPAAIGKGLPVTITAGGITTPGNVAYTWEAPDFTPSTFTGATFEAIAPNKAKECYIYVTAHSAGYRDVTKKKQITVLECVSMQGLLDIDVPVDVVSDETVQFTAMGITSPVEENITYQWYAPNFTPDSYTGSTIFKAKAPKQAETYKVTVVAKAENYCDTSIYKVIQVKPGRKMQGTFQITDGTPTAMVGEKITFTAHGITTPTAELITYTWRASAFNSGAGTESGNSYTTICPPNPETYTVEVTAHAIGYSDSTVRRNDITVYPKNTMQGNISISDPPAEIVTSQSVMFYVTKNFTTQPEGISFEWNAPDFTSPTYEPTGNTFTATAPAAEGDYTITVTAKAPRYEDKKASAIVTVKGGKTMTGTLDFDEPSQIVKDLPAAFTISSRPTAGELLITYEWDAPGFDPATFSGPTFTGTPTIAGQRTITLHAIADGYTTRSIDKPVNVIDGLDMGTLTISASSDPPFNAGINTVTFTPSFTDLPISPITYTWEATNCIPGSSTSNTYNPTLPKEAGNYEIKLTAQATGYLPKEASFTYSITCRPMTVGFTISPRTELLTKDETTLSVVPPSAPTSGLSYTWTIPAGFDVPDDLTTPSITIKAPHTGLVDPATLTLTAEAVNYCPATHTATVTVKECYDLTTPKIISVDRPIVDGVVIVPSRRNVTFSTDKVTPWKTGGTVTYNWSFSENSLKFNPPAQSTGSNTFVTAAPAHNADTYTLTLQVEADGYCTHSPVTQEVVIKSYTEQLKGTIYVKEAMKTTNPSYANQDTTIWLAKDYPATLTAIYVPAPGEAGREDDLNLKWTWSWTNEQSVTKPLDGIADKNTIGLSPSATVTNQRLIVTVEDDNGRGPTSRAYNYTVQACNYTGNNDLFVNINNQCGTLTIGNYTAFIKDAEDQTIYRIVQIGQRWWFAENLKKNTGVYKDKGSSLGFFYSKEERNNDNICPEGWRISDMSDWTNLKSALSTDQFENLTINRTSGAPYDGTAWASYRNLGNNQYGFSAIPAGFLNGSTQRMQGEMAYFLTKGGTQVYYLGNPDITTNDPEDLDGILELTNISSSEAYYTVRCVRNFNRP